MLNFVDFMKYLPALGTWVAGFIPGAIGGYVISLRTQYAAREIRAREAHLEDLKSAVMEPTFLLLKRHYLPICQLQLGAVVASYVNLTRDPSSVTEDAHVGGEFHLAIRNPSPGPISSNYAQIGGERRGEHGERFSADAKEFHFKPLFLRLDKFLSAFSKVAQEVLKHSSQIQKVLVDRLALPAGAGFGQSIPEWANYPRLAVFICERQMGITRNHIFSRSPELYGAVLSVSGASEEILKFKWEGDVKKGLGVLDELVNDTAGVDVLMRSLKSLEPEAQKLLLDFQHQIATKKLPKKCPLI